MGTRNLTVVIYNGNSYTPVEYTRWKEKDAIDNFGVVGKVKDISFAELKKNVR